MSGEEFYVEDIEISGPSDINEALELLDDVDLEEPGPAREPSFGTLANPGAQPPADDETVFDPNGELPAALEPGAAADEIEVPGHESEQKESWKERLRKGMERSGNDGEPVEWGERIPTPQSPDPEAAEKLSWRERINFSSDDSGEQEGLLKRLHRRFGIEDDPVEEEEQALGVDTSPAPSGPLARLRARFTGQSDLVAAAEADERADLGDLLRPLSGPEIAMLQMEVAKEVPVFEQINTHQRAVSIRYEVAFYLGILAIVAFFFVYGKSYLLEILPEAELPEQLSSPPGDIDPKQWQKIGESGLFVIGLLLPFAALYVAIDAFRRLLSAAGELRIFDLLLGAAGAVVTYLALMSLAEAEILRAAVLLAGYGIVQAAYGRWLRWRAHRG